MSKVSQKVTNFHKRREFIGGTARFETMRLGRTELYHHKILRMKLYGLALSYL